MRYNSGLIMPSPRYQGFKQAARGVSALHRKYKMKLKKHLFAPVITFMRRKSGGLVNGLVSLVSNHNIPALCSRTEQNSSCKTQTHKRLELKSRTVHQSPTRPPGAPAR